VHALIVREHGGGGADLCSHVANGGHACRERRAGVAHYIMNQACCLSNQLKRCLGNKRCFVVSKPGHDAENDVVCDSHVLGE
jgi:hypothetical protein